MKPFQFNNKTRTLFIAVIYIAFTIFSIYNIVKAPQISSKIFYACLLIVALSIAIYAEYLRTIYQKCIQTLTIDCDPLKADQQFKALLKKDIFKAYNKTYLIFQTLYYADMLDPKNCLNTLEKDEKFFHSSLDMLLVYHYTKFYANFLLNNLEEVKNEYSHLTKLKGAKIKGDKVAPLYNYEFIDSIYQFALKKYKQSLNCFKSINTKNMNPRELLHYHYQLQALYLKLHQPSAAKVHQKEIIKIGGTTKIWKEIHLYENE